MDQKKMNGASGVLPPVTVTAEPAVGADDARYSDQGTFSAAASSLQIGISSVPENWNTYIRFVLDVPPGKTITSATVKFIAANARTAKVLGADIQADVSALDPTVPGSQAAAIARAKTTALVNWNTGSITYVAGDAITSANFATVLQEIVNQVGWARNNHIVVYFQENGSGAASDLQPAALEHATLAAPLLSVTYQP